MKLLQIGTKAQTLGLEKAADTCMKTSLQYMKDKEDFETKNTNDKYLKVFSVF